MIQTVNKIYCDVPRFVYIDICCGTVQYYFILYFKLYNNTDIKL